MRFYLLFLMAVFCADVSVAAPGKLVLKNGKCMTGDIRTNTDGSVWFTRRDGSIEFTRGEIQRVILFSSRDPVRETFVSSLKITSPGSSGKRGVATPYDAIIHQESLKNNLDPALVKAVIKAESNFNPKDRSNKGACGLMQLMPETARRLGVKDIYSPQENICAGTRFLRDMMTTFNGSIEKALAAYNAGPSVVKRYNSIPPYRETQKYVKDVSRYYGKFRDPGTVHSYEDDSGCLKLYNVR